MNNTWVSYGAAARPQVRHHLNSFASHATRPKRAVALLPPSFAPTPSRVSLNPVLLTLDHEPQRTHAVCLGQCPCVGCQRAAT